MDAQSFHSDRRTARRDDGALIVFAREPRAGLVKTRLAATIGATAAAAVYAGLLDRTLRLAECSKFSSCYLFAAHPAQMTYFADRLDLKRWQVRAQCAGDIGQRMHVALDNVLQVHRFAVLIGSDVADFSTADLDTAFDSLGRHDNRAVLGPSVDGGYWLIGVDKINQRLFTNMRWSTPNVAAITLERMASLGLQVVSLIPRHDIDDCDDLVYVAQPARMNAGFAKH